MAVSLPSRDSTFKVIIRADSALDVTDEEYNQYLEGLDEGVLKFKAGEEPTRFVMRKVLRWDLAKNVKNQTVKYRDGEVQIQAAYMMEEVRASLVGVENPPNLKPEDAIEFKKDGDGGASKDLMELLEAVGAVDNLFKARQNQAVKVSENVKKS